MPLKVHYKSGELKGHTLDFDDDHERIEFGRDPERCDVVFPPSATMVGREHCALERVLGRYRLITNGTNPVFLDGRPGQDDDLLKPLAEMRLGEDGPLLLVETVLDRRLETTVAAGRGAESPPTLRQRIRRSVLTNRVIALLAVLVAVAAVVHFTSQSSKQRSRVEEVEKQLESTMVEISSLSEQERERIARALETVQEQDPARRFQALIARVEPSVYLVMVRTAPDALTALGTAWVVKPGVLATNAHVAEVFETLTAGQSMLVRSTAETPRDFAVTGVTIHPGFDRFKQAVADRRPLDTTSGDEAVFIPACDVGLLHVAKDADLGVPLELAPKDVLHRLEAGEAVAFIGHPLEWMELRDLSRPQPTSLIGHITSLTDVFNGKTIPARRLLVRHDLPVTGGVSGSPLLNRDGQVVAVISAGSFHVIMDVISGLPRRVPTAVGVNFAQRSDLLAELLDGTAEAAQAERDREWRAELSRFQSGRKTREEILQQLLRYFDTHVRTRGVRPKSIDKVLEKAGRIDKPGLAEGKAFQVDVPAAGHYLISAIADQVKDLDVAVFEGTRVVAKDEMRDHFPSVICRLAAGAKIKILVHLKPTKLPGTPFVLYMYRAVE
jgi:S1-C subfamily serine protease